MMERFRFPPGIIAKKSASAAVLAFLPVKTDFAENVIYITP